MADVDWTNHDRYAENTCHCRCGAVFRSHSKFVMDPPHIEARKPCPACGRTDDLRKAESDPEPMFVRRGDETC